MKKIRVAQIGINRYSHAPEIFHTMKSLPELFEVVGYTLVEDERETCADKLEVFEGFKELTLYEILNDPTIEAVAVETDEIHLTKYAIMAAEHNKHIHMEKPGSQSLPDFERLMELVKSNDKVFHTGYMYRYNPFVSDAITRAKGGELGEVFAVETHMSRTDGTEVREWLESFKGGMMFYLGCHLIDLVMQVKGIPERVVPLNRSTGFDGIHTEDYAMALLEYPSGFSIVRTAATEIGGFNRRQFVIMGKEGTIEINPLEAYPSEDEVKHTRFAQKAGKVERIRRPDGTLNVTSVESEQFDRYVAMMQAFAAMVRGEIVNPYTLEYEYELFKVILKCCGVD